MNGKRLVIVEWLDHSERTEWTDLRDLKDDPLHVFSIGWIVRETDDTLTIVANYSAEGEEVSLVVGAMQILKKTIISVQAVTGLQKRKRKP